MTDIFNGIEEKSKRKLLRLLEAQTLNFKKGDTILSTVKEDNVIGVILEGYLQIIRTDYNGNRTIIEELYENDIFGTAISSLEGKDYDIITKEDAKVLIIDYDNVLNSLRSNSFYYNRFLKNLLDIVTQRIQEKNE